MPVRLRAEVTRLSVIRQNESSPDEPFLWVFLLKADGTTIKVDDPANARISLEAPLGAHGNLGAASDDMTTGQAVPIPAALGRFDVTLRPLAFLPAAQFVGFALAVGALEEDATTNQQICAVHAHVVSKVREAANEALETLLATAPENGLSADALQTGLLDSVDESKVTGWVYDFVEDSMGPVIGTALAFAPTSGVPVLSTGNLIDPFVLSTIVQAADRDDFVGYFYKYKLLPDLLRESLKGTQIDERVSKDSILKAVIARLLFGSPKGPALKELLKQLVLPQELINQLLEIAETADSERDQKIDALMSAWPDSLKNKLIDGGEGRYRITGRIRRLDSPEPPTLGAVMWGDTGRVAVVGRELLEERFVLAQRLPGQPWEQRTTLGDQVFTSGPGVAASGSTLLVVGRVSPGHLALASFAVGQGRQARFAALGDREFRTGAGIAAAAPRAARAYVASTATDGRVYLATLAPEARGWQIAEGWRPLGSFRVLTTPAVACSANGQVVHIMALQENFSLVHAASFNGGRDFTVNTSPGITKELISAPSLACSSNGSELWVGGMAEGGVLALCRLMMNGAFVRQDWFEMKGRFVSSPALCGSANANALHVFALRYDLQIAQRFSGQAQQSKGGFPSTDWEKVAWPGFGGLLPLKCV